MALALIYTIILFALFWLFGQGLLSLLLPNLEKSELKFFYTVAAGTMVFSAMLFVLAAVGGYGLAGVLIGCAILSTASFVAARKTIVSEVAGYKGIFQGKSALVTLPVFLVSLPGLLLALTPPYYKDTLIYHLYIPKLMIAGGGFTQVPGLSNTSFPLGFDLIWGVGLMLGRPEVAKLAHFGFFFLLLGAVYKLGNRFGKWGGLTAALLIALTPSMQIVACWAYIDIALAFITVMTLSAFCDKKLQDKTGGLIFVGLLLGFTLWAKYLSLYFAAYSPVLLFVAMTRNGDKPQQAFKKLVIIGIAAAIFASPFYIKNVIETGNPVFPYFIGVFGGEQQWDDFFDKSYFHLLSSYGYGEGASKYLLAPVYMALHAQFESVRFDGVIGLVWLPLFILIIAGLFKRKDSSPLYPVFALSILFGYVLWLTNSQQLRFLLPTLAVAPVLGVAAISGLIENQKGRMAGLAVLVALACLGFVDIGKYFRQIEPLPYLLGSESRSDFLNRVDPLQKTYGFINQNTPEDAYVYLLIVGNKRFYLDRKAYSDSIFEYYTLQKVIRAAKTPEGVAAWFAKNGFTHMLLDEHYVKKPFEKDEWAVLTQFFANYSRPLFKDGYFVVVQLKPPAK